MQLPLTFRRRLSLVAVVLLTAVLAAACSGGVRPTLTGDRLVETPDIIAADPPVAAPTPLVVAAPTPAPEAPAESSGAASATAGDVEQLVVKVIETFPHDSTAFTQGLELHNGALLESIGLYGESELRRVDPVTGSVLQSVQIDDAFFAEGLTRVGDQVIQLTWRENTAFYSDVNTLERTKEVSYQGEGWGLCYDGVRLIMTDGQPELIFRDPATFDETGRVAVTLNAQPVFNLNEIECVGGVIWANIWQTDLIVRIDPTTGAVTGLVDAANLDGPADAAGAVLNGIAWDEATQSFFVTGKLWPTMYRVNFIPASAS